MKKKFLYDSLIEYAKNGRYGFHMPGHKRQGSLLNGMDPYDIDITEIEGFDNLHCARGIIKNSMDKASEELGTDRTWFMVNGSTGGILAAINSVTYIGDTILIGRNCHKSVYNAVEIRNLKAEYLYPKVIEELGIFGGYDVLDVEKKLSQNPNIKAIVITSPTYEGLVSDVKKIAEIAHRYNAVVIVDEAHGAHFSLSDKLPIPAYKLGADIVIESSHKTLTSLTQTALIHLMRGRVCERKLERYLSVYQSSSPSYVLMASIDKCINDISEQGEEKTEKLLTKIKDFRENVNNLKNMFIPGEELINKHGIVDVDPTKLSIFIKGKATTGVKLASILREDFNFEVEMEGENFVLAITSISDNLDKLDELYEALKKIDESLVSKEEKICLKVIGENKSAMSAYEALQLDTEYIFIGDSQGRISAEYVSLYPPGIPLIVPGEIISQEMIEKIKEYKELGLNIIGLDDEKINKIKVVKE